MLSKNDIRFGKIAVRERLLTREQLNKAIKTKKKLEEKRPDKEITLAAVLHRKGYLDKAQIDEVVRLHNARVKTRSGDLDDPSGSGNASGEGSGSEGAADAVADSDATATATKTKSRSKTRPKKTRTKTKRSSRLPADDESAAPAVDEPAAEPDADEAKTSRRTSRKTGRSGKSSGKTRSVPKTDGANGNGHPKSGENGRNGNGAVSAVASAVASASASYADSADLEASHSLRPTIKVKAGKLIVSCPDCGKKFAAKEKQLGRKFKCRGCGEVLRLPKSLDEPDPPRKKRRRKKPTAEAEAATATATATATEEKTHRRKRRKSKTASEPAVEAPEKSGATAVSDAEVSDATAAALGEASATLSDEATGTETRSKTKRSSKSRSERRSRRTKKKREKPKFDKPNPGVLTKTPTKQAGAKQSAWERAKAAIELAKAKKEDRDSNRHDEGTSGPGFKPAQLDVLEASSADLGSDDEDALEAARSGSIAVPLSEAKKRTSGYADAVDAAIEKTEKLREQAELRRKGLLPEDKASPAAIAAMLAIILATGGAIAGVVYLQSKGDVDAATVRAKNVEEEIARNEARIREAAQRASELIAIAKDPTKRGNANQVHTEAFGLVHELETITKDAAAVPTPDAQKAAVALVAELQYVTLIRDLHVVQGDARRWSKSLDALEVAVDNYGDAFALDPTFFEALEKQAEVEWIRRRYAIAATVYERLLSKGKEEKSSRRDRWRLRQVVALALAGKYQDASTELQPLLKDDRELGLLRARIMGLQGTTATAIQEAASSGAPEARTEFVKGEIYRLRNKLDEAEQAYASSKTADGAEPRGPWGLGMVALARWDFEAAAEHFAESGRRDPAFAPALIGEASARLGLLDVDRALAALDEAATDAEEAWALTQAPDHVWAFEASDPFGWEPGRLLSEIRRRQADVYLLKDQQPQAEARITEALRKVDPFSPLTLALGAEVVLLRGDKHAAESHLRVARRALEQVQPDAAAPAAVGGVRVDKDLEDYSDLVTSDETAAYLIAVGRFQLARDEFGRAQRALDKAVRIRGDDPEARTLFGQALMQMHDEVAAAVHYGQALKLETESGTAAGSIYLAAKAAVEAALASKEAEAVRKARGLIALALHWNENHASALILSSKLHEGLEEWEPAEAALARAVEANPFCLEAFLELGYLLTIRSPNRRAEEAHAAFERAIELDGTNVKAWVGRGVARYVGNNIRGAHEDLTKAIEIDPAYPETYRYRFQLNRDRRNFEEAKRDAIEYERLTGEKLLDG